MRLGDLAVNRMRHMARRRPTGFTLLELLTAVAIIGILAAIALFGYQRYTVRAAATDLIAKHHDIRTAAIAGLGDATFDDCAALAARLDRKSLVDPYATLDYGFEAVPGGYRPVLDVCVTAERNPQGVAVAQRAHENFAGMGVAEKNPVLTASVVSYALRLTADDLACAAARKSAKVRWRKVSPGGTAYQTGESNETRATRLHRTRTAHRGGDRRHPRCVCVHRLPDLCSQGRGRRSGVQAS